MSCEREAKTIDYITCVTNVELVSDSVFGEGTFWRSGDGQAAGLGFGGHWRLEG